MFPRRFEVDNHQFVLSVCIQILINLESRHNKIHDLQNASLSALKRQILEVHLIKL